jgi:ubiquinone/menaquinone biosynthesis C-methylase UbiE
MEPTGAGAFLTSGAAYDAYMGRYSRQLSGAFADLAGVAEGHMVLDVGCGPGALTGVLVERLGAASVAAFDPSPPFVAECAARCPGVDVRAGRAEEIPFEDGRFDRALAQLVLHFVADPAEAAREIRRVLRPDGVFAACVWDFADGMEMLRAFWDAALEVDPEAPDEARLLRFGEQGEIATLLEGAGFQDVVETTITVSSSYADFAELWSGFLAGIGPAGAYLLTRDDAGRDALRDAMFRRLDAPAGPFTLGAVARYAAGRSPRPAAI